MKKTTKRNLIIGAAVVLVFGTIGLIADPKKSEVDDPETEPATEITSASEETAPDDLTDGYKIKFGELLSVVDNAEDHQLIFKAKVNSQTTNKLTIDQNFHNIAYLAENFDLSDCEELQYWAVSDARDGSEVRDRFMDSAEPSKIKAGERISRFFDKFTKGNKNV